jgi:ATP-dependent Clp protease adapter protein ClpS
VPTKEELLDAARKAREALNAVPPEEMATAELRRALDRAGTDAHERDKSITIEHLLCAILAEPIGAEILRECGADIHALHRDLVQFLDVASAPKERGAQQSLPHQRVLKRAQMQMNAAGAKQISIGDVLASMFREPNEYAVTLLGKQGVTRLDILRYVTHKIHKADSSVRLPRAQVVGGTIEHRHEVGEYQVVFHNDNYTTREFVIETLSSLFGKTRDEAVALSTAVHENGTQVVGEYDLKVALKKVAKTNRRAEKAGFPLKLTILFSGEEPR